MLGILGGIAKKVHCLKVQVFLELYNAGSATLFEALHRYSAPQLVPMNKCS